MLNRVELRPRGLMPEPSSARASSRSPDTGFAAAFERELQGAREVKFSAHALQRLSRRGIALTPTDTAHLERAIDRAAEKGARETVLLLDRLALVVSVPNRTVITVVPEQEFEDTVFTNIDSAVVVATRGPLPPLK